MDEHELAVRTYELPGRFADRLDLARLAVVREYAEVGEWGEEIDLLLACLRMARRPVTAAERAELMALLQAMGLPAEPVEELGSMAPEGERLVAGGRGSSRITRPRGAPGPGGVESER